MAAVVAVVMFPVASRAASAAGAPAAPSAFEPQQVVVTAREPALEEKSYRDILAAVTEFEHYHAAHPDAELRFHIFQRKEGIDMSQLRAWIQDPEDGTRVPSSGSWIQARSCDMSMPSFRWKMWKRSSASGCAAW